MAAFVDLREPDGGRCAEENIGQVVTTNSAATRVNLIRGRLFAPDEGKEEPHVAVISYSLWQRRFGGDENLVGRTVQLNNLPHTISWHPARRLCGMFPQLSNRQTGRHLESGNLTQDMLTRCGRFACAVARLNQASI